MSAESTPSITHADSLWVRANREALDGKLPAYEERWLYNDTDLDWSTFRILRNRSLIDAVGKAGEYTVWRTTRALDSCVRRHHGDDALVTPGGPD